MKPVIAVSLLFVSYLNYAYARLPQAAIDACKNISEGLQCVVHTPRGDLTGICQQPPHESQAICIPQNATNPTQANRNTPNQGRTRQHTVNQSDGHVDTVSASVQSSSTSNISISIIGNDRVLQANGLANHATGQFPNQGNPHAISSQNYYFRIPAKPQLTDTIVALGLHDFGLAINGVPFDPGAAEWYLGQRQGNWQYEPLSGAIPLGVDDNHAHVQPSGAYHYHGLPTLLLNQLNVSHNQHSPLIGWAADGFPIYALYGYQNGDSSNLVEMTSSYQLRKGNRPSSGNNPGGHYDGTFVEDYIYVKGAGRLDKCNGIQTITPEFPNGSYVYFLSKSWPVIPRCFKGTPSTDFTLQRARR